MRIFAIVALSVLLGACATAYKPKGFTGGFSETQLDRNVFRVSFRGNGYTRPERAEDFALLRSAELVLKNGFTHFIIIDGRSSTEYGAYTTPTQSYTTGSVTSFGNTAYGSATTTTYGGQTFLIRRPSATNTIVCFQGKPDIPGLVYDAQFVFYSLAQKYGITSAPNE
jgi:hypothetical protein